MHWACRQSSQQHISLHKGKQYLFFVFCLSFDKNGAQFLFYLIPKWLNLCYPLNVAEVQLSVTGGYVSQNFPQDSLFPLFSKNDGVLNHIESHDFIRIDWALNFMMAAFGGPQNLLTTKCSVVYQAGADSTGKLHVTVTFVPQIENLNVNITYSRKS